LNVSPKWSRDPWRRYHLAVDDNRKKLAFATKGRGVETGTRVARERDVEGAVAAHMVQAYGADVS